MVAFGHTSIGAVVGLLSYDHFSTLPPAIGLPLTGVLGVVSHYLADLLPHGHFFPAKDFKKKIYLDIVFDLFLSILVFAGITCIESGFSLKLLYVLFGIGGSQLPDILDGSIYAGYIKAEGLLGIEHKFHQSTHWHDKKKEGRLWSKSDIWQIAVLVVSLALFLIH